MKFIRYDFNSIYFNRWFFMQIKIFNIYRNDRYMSIHSLRYRSYRFKHILNKIKEGI